MVPSLGLLPSSEMNLSAEGNNSPRAGPSHFPDQGTKILWPTAIDQKFMDVAYNTRDESGKHKECMAYVCGYKDQEGTHATHLIFPAQEGSSSRVDDLGILGQDTTLYMAQTVAPSVNEPDREYKLISWMHTHVRGTVAGFSAIDLHTQHGLAHHVSPGIFGTVYELTENRYMYRKEPYVLTDEGQARVGECEHTLGVANQQHSECFHTKFYKSIKDQLSLTDNDITVIDGRKSKPLNAQPSSEFTDPTTEVVGSNQCRACKQKFDDVSALLMHVGRKKLCKPTYESEIGDFRDFVRKQNQNKKRKTFIERHPGRVTEIDNKAYRKRAGKTQGKPVSKELTDDDFVCPICDATFTWKQNKDRHMREVHPSSADGDKVKCPDCVKTFSRQDYMNQHWQFAHADNPTLFYCVECEKPFTQRQTVIRHFNEIHLGEQYICQQCPAIFSRKYQFNKHNERAEHWQYHYCWDCDKVVKMTFEDEWQLHMNCHQQQKKAELEREVGWKVIQDYKGYRHHYIVDDRMCPICNTTFDSTFDWGPSCPNKARHMREVHPGVAIADTLSFKCTDCGKGFIAPEALQAHRAGPCFQCADCGKAFNTQEKLIAHRAGPCLKCSDCGNIFPTPESLKDHKESRHADTSDRKS